MVVMEMENGGKIKIQLDETAAPKTVKNFEDLVKKGFYDGLTFHLSLIHISEPTRPY